MSVDICRPMLLLERNVPQAGTWLAMEPQWPTQDLNEEWTHAALTTSILWDLDSASFISQPVASNQQFQPAVTPVQYLDRAISEESGYHTAQDDVSAISWVNSAQTLDCYSPMESLNSPPDDPPADSSATQQWDIPSVLSFEPEDDIMDFGWISQPDASATTVPAAEQTSRVEDDSPVRVLAPSDPRTWTADDVTRWFRWLINELQIDMDPSAFPSVDGETLCWWTAQDFDRVAGTRAGPLLAAHLRWQRRPFLSTG